MIKAIILDFDGLIFDTETMNYTVTKEAYSQFGVTLTLDLWRQVFLETSEIQHQVITEHSIQKINYDQVGQLRAEKFRAGISNLQIRPGVRSYLDDAKRMGLKIGLATNADRFYVEEIFLKRLHLYNYFDCIRTKEDAARKKPEPDIYISVLEGLNLNAHDAVAFEDSPMGAKAAKCAGIKCVVVPNFVTEELVFEDIDYQLSSMLDMNIEELLKRLR